VFENRVLRRIFGPKGDEVAGGWRENFVMRCFITCTLLHFNYSHQIKGCEMEIACSTNLEDLNSYTVSVRTQE
jgi:hypothetical protein